jgi:GAF domain-containing protein
MSTENTIEERILRDSSDILQQVGGSLAFVDQSNNAEVVLAERSHLLALSAAVATALAGNDSLRAILQQCAAALVQHLGVAAAYIWTLEAEGKVLETQASAGIYIPLGDLYGSIPVDESTIGSIAQERQPYVTDAVLTDARLRHEAWARWTKLTAFAGHPLVVEDRVLGVMAVFAKQPFTHATLKALAWVAGVMAMGIDRICFADALARSISRVVRMNRSLLRKNAELDEFTYMASHDLQESLRKLITFSGLLRKDLGDDLPERAAKDLDFIVDAAAHVHALVQGLLEFTLAHGRDA